MISSDLLQAMQEADPALWIRYVEGRNLIEDEDFDSQIGDLIDAVKEAWLQACLQDAIRARGWHLYQIRNDDLPEKPCFVSIYNPTEGIKEHDSHQNGEGSTEAEALGWAYLTALKSP